MKQIEKLVEKINKQIGLDIPQDVKVKYLRPTINQQSRGMFKWVFNSPKYLRYGSTMGIRELLSCKKLYTSYTTFGGLSVMPISLIDILGKEE